MLDKDNEVSLTFSQIISKLLKSVGDLLLSCPNTVVLELIRPNITAMVYPKK